MKLRDVDWRRVLEDFTTLGMTGEELAGKVGLRSGLLQLIATGRHPPAPAVRERLAGLWCHLTGKPPQFLPMASRHAQQERPPIPDLDQDCPWEPCKAQMDAIDQVFRMIISRG